MKKTIKALVFTSVFSSLAACSAITDFTSSTSSTLDAATPDITLNDYLDKRFEAIRKDAATGSGENIEALAQLMGRTDTAAFASLMQNNYDELFGNLKQPSDLISRIEKLNVDTKG
ncbi:MAG: DUF3015 domain-containing protein [Gammaproteobacteria bacterium]|nr:DUF3015 domain-containing protein [Gammaproteobacteria bacterium]